MLPTAAPLASLAPNGLMKRHALAALLLSRATADEPARGVLRGLTPASGHGNFQQLGPSGCTVLEKVHLCMGEDGADEMCHDASPRREFVCEDLGTRAIYTIDNNITAIAQGSVGAFEFADDYAVDHLLDSATDDFVGEAQIDVATGHISLITGKFGRHQNSTGPREALESVSRHLQHWRQYRQPTGVHTVVILNVVSSEGNVTGATDWELADTMREFADQFSACSHNQLNFRPQSDSASANTAVSDLENGVATVHSTVASSQGETVMVNDAIDKLSAAHGVRGGADYVMVCLPRSMREWAAYAVINSYLSVYSKFVCTDPSLLMHEVGHNLGLSHASESGQEYGDTSGSMGYSFYSFRRCFTAPKTYKLGWFEDRHVELTAPTQGFEGRLYGFTQWASTTSADKMIIRLNDPSCTTCDWYISFNHQAGFNTDTGEGKNQVQLHTKAGTPAMYVNTYVQAKLAAHSRYTAVINGNDIEVAVGEINTAEGWAEVNVNWDTQVNAQFHGLCGDQGYIRCQDGFAMEGGLRTGLSCYAACEGQCCQGPNDTWGSCQNTHAVICKDGISCNTEEGNEPACESAVIPFIYKGCNGHEACLWAGFVRPGVGPEYIGIGMVLESCRGYKACRFAGRLVRPGLGIGNIVDSCKADHACNGAGWIRGKTGQDLIGCCNTDQECCKHCWDTNFTDSYPNSCRSTSPTTAPTEFPSTSTSPTTAPTEFEFPTWAPTTSPACLKHEIKQINVPGGLAGYVGYFHPISRDLWPADFDRHRATDYIIVKICNMDGSEKYEGLIRIQHRWAIEFSIARVEPADWDNNIPINDGDYIVAAPCACNRHFPQLVRNGGFEGAIGEDWQHYGPYYVSDQFVRSGHQSIRVPNYGGAKQVISLHDVNIGARVTIKGWSKAVGVSSGLWAGNYAIYGDVQYEDGTWLYAQIAEFRGGTHEFEYAEHTIYLEKQASHLNLHALYRRDDQNPGGMVYFDDVEVIVWEDSQ